MQVLVRKQALTCLNMGNWKPKPTERDPEAGRYEGGGAAFQLRPHEYIQNVPDWLRKDATFQAGVKAGFVIPLRTEVPVPEIAVPEPTPVPGISTQTTFDIKNAAEIPIAETASTSPVAVGETINAEDVPAPKFGGGKKGK